MKIFKNSVLRAIYQKNVSKILFSFSMSTLFMVVGLTSTNFYYLYKEVTASQENIVFEELKNKALIMSSVIDMESYEKILNSKIQHENEDYQKNLSPLKKAHASIKGLRYVYTVYVTQKKNQSTAYFGLDTALKIDADKDGVIDHSEFRSEYADAPKEIFEAVKTGKITYTDRPYEDKYGTFISAFIPLKNSKGKVISVLGIDMLYTQHQAMLDGYRNEILKIYLICIFMVSMFTIMLYFFYNKITQYKIQQVSLKNELKNQQDFFIQDSKMAEIGKMVAGITHEINNPLTIIKGLSDQGIKKLKRDNLDIEAHLKNYESIKGSSERIIEVIHNMKSIIGRPIGTDDFYYFAFYESIENVLKAIKYKSASEKVNFKFEIDKKLLIYGNRSQLEQVFFNLLSNSLDAIASEENPWIKIEVERDDNFFKIHFLDSGKGLSREVYRKIERGYYTSKTNGNGSGMGLMICKKIVSIHSGTLDFIEDLTTHFIIKIPKDESIKNKLEENLEEEADNESGIKKAV